MYVCMDGTYALLTRAGNIFLQKTRLFRLDPSLFWNYSTKQALHYTQAPKCEKILLFKKQKVDSTGYYGIEDPFPDLVTKLRRFMGDTECRLFGCQEPLVVRMP